jgi:hypothetical protein
VNATRAVGAEAVQTCSLQYESRFLTLTNARQS